MARWRVLTLVLMVLAVALWAALFAFNLRPQLGSEVLLGISPASSLHLQGPLSGLPRWVASVELFVTLFLAGVANFFLFPARLRNMVLTVGRGWARLALTTVLGIGFGLLIIVFGFGAALARITFPFTILAALVLVFLSVWGFLAVAYAVGRLLLAKAGWGGLSPALGLALGLLLLLPLIRIPFAGGVVMIVYVGLGLGLVVSTRFGSNQSWSLNPLLEEDTE